MALTQVTPDVLHSNQGNITTVGTLGNLTVSGNVSAGNVSGTYLTGTITTASQTNITGVGTITTGTWSADTIAINKGGTGATTTGGVGGALDNILPSGEQTGYVLSTSGAGTYSWVAPQLGGTTVGQSLITLRQANTATSGQTIFTLVSGTTYTPGAGQLRVYINGVRQFPTEYTETSTTVYTMGTGVSTGDIVFAEIDKASSFNNYANLTYASNVGSIAAVGLTVQSAIESLETNKATATSVTTANTAMKGYVDGVTTAWMANAAVQAGDIAGKIGTTDFTGSNQSKTANGYQKLPGGLIIQWGTTASIGGGATVITLPIAYTAAHFTAVITGLNGTGTVQNRDFVPTKTLTTFTINNQGIAGPFNWISIGV